MAFISANLALVSSVNGFSLYRYDTLDSHATVDVSGYFDNEDDTLNMGAGDLIDVIVWATAIRSGSVISHERHIVNSV